MPPSRPRFALDALERLARFWPVVCLVGLRQVGKTTLTLQLSKVAEQVSLDDDQAQEEAEAAPGVFLSKRHEPILIDEVQKSPKLFDAIKLTVDRKRRPGRFFLTGSARFSAKLGIRESLAGRIGLLQLYPLTLAEAHEKPFAKD
jgi:predicted AAA+ superfamily ATPase